MESIGFEREDRAFTAHLTLGRFRTSIEKEGLLKAVKLHEKDTFVGSINVQSLSLIRSDLHPEGARYTKIIDITLGKTTANT